MINGILFDLDGTLLEHRTAADTAIGAWVSERAPGNPRLGEAAALAALGGFRIGVLTNGAQEIQEEKVRAIGLEGRVGPVLTGEVLGGSYRNRPQCSGLQAEGEATLPRKRGRKADSPPRRTGVR